MAIPLQCSHSSFPGNWFITQKLSLQITVKSSWHFFFNHNSQLNHTPTQSLNSPTLKLNFPALHWLGRSNPLNSALGSHSLTHLLIFRLVLLITPRCGPHREHRLYCYATQLSRREHLLPVSPLMRVMKLLRSNGRCLQNNYLATGLRAAGCRPLAK
jgi:hypothetical protein